MKNGIVRRVTGPVVDVQFPAGHLPDIYNAIEIQLEDRKVVMAVSYTHLTLPTTNFV